MTKMFKVISAVEDKEGKTKFWMRLGTAFLNRDNSINVHLDAFPKSMQLQIRELDEEDLRGGGDGARRRRRGEGEGELALPMPAVRCCNLRGRAVLRGADHENDPCNVSPACRHRSHRRARGRDGWKLGRVRHGQRLSDALDTRGD